MQPGIGRTESSQFTLFILRGQGGRYLVLVISALVIRRDKVQFPSGVIGGKHWCFPAPHQFEKDALFQPHPQVIRHGAIQGNQAGIDAVILAGVAEDPVLFPAETTGLEQGKGLYEVRTIGDDGFVFGRYAERLRMAGQ